MKKLSNRWMLDDILKAKKKAGSGMYQFYGKYSLPKIARVTSKDYGNSYHYIIEDEFVTATKELMDQAYQHMVDAMINGSSNIWIGVDAALPRGTQQETADDLPMFPQLQEEIHAGSKRYAAVTKMRAHALPALKDWLDQLEPQFTTQYRYKCLCRQCAIRPVEFIHFKSPNEITFEDSPLCKECGK